MFHLKIITILIAGIFLVQGCANPVMDQTFDSPDGEWRTGIQYSAGRMSLGTMTFAGSKKATYTYRNGRVLFNETDSSGKWKGHWVEDTWSGAICAEEKDGSKSWGEMVYQFNDTYTRFKGTYNICGTGLKNAWEGTRI